MLVALGTLTEMPPFVATVPPNSCVLAEFREQLTQWLVGLGMPPETRDDIVLAAHEAVANGIEYGPAVPVQVTARSNTTGIAITVVSEGPWDPRVDESLERGRGLMLMRYLMTDVQVLCEPGRVTVHLLLDW